MKKTLRIFVFAAMLLASLGLWARPVSVDHAHRVAESFLRGIGCKNASSLVNRSSELSFHQFYLFASEQGGFVLVAADDCVVPILGYSTTNVFDVKGMPAHVADWLSGYEEQIAYFVRQDARLRSSGLQCGDDNGNIVAQQWKLLLAGQNLEQTNNSSVSPLLSTTWNQSPYYNDLCPVDYDNYTGHAYAGCTAIATAQVMKYWNHPSVGYGSTTYYHDTYGNLSANFGGTTYQWSGMPNALSSSSTSSQINAVATLVYHVGVAVNMNYGPNGSGAQTISSGDPVQPSAENALKNNFKYSSSLHSIHRSDYAPEVFAGILCTELDNSRPIIFTGYDVDAGHAFVLDGYDSYGNFHVNWGWGSYCDGYYAMGALNPSTGGAGGNTSGTYNINNSAIIGVEPNNSFSTTGTTYVSVAANPSSYGYATGGGYYAFGDTVYLRANANAGCRFSQWNDGYRCNPRGFLAMGGNYSHTANFEQLSGDTLGYVSANTMISSFGTGGTSSNFVWGIRLPASVLTPSHDLKKVQMYVAYAGTYTTNIYVGSASSTPVASQTFTATTADEGTWKTITLTTPVTVTGSQDIYITFENTGVEYPAALSYDCGNDDGLLCGSSLNSIRSIWNYTFMVRGIFGSSIPTGDTLSYCEDNLYESNVGAGGNIYWGIKIPGSWQVGHTYLSSVQLYVVNPGTYDLILAQGGTNAPSTIIPIQSVSFGSNDVHQWHSIPIATTYMLDSSQPLWVVFHNTDATYPAAACIANPDSNSSWCSTNGTTWRSLYTLSGGSLDYSWMIKCAVSNTLPAPNVSISGDTYFQTFTSKTFSAQSNLANASFAWTLPGATPSYATGATVTAFWPQAGIYEVVVAAASGGVIVRDTLQVEVYDCAPQSVPWVEYFNNATNNCWTYIGYQPSSSRAGIQYDNWTIYNGGLVSFTSASSTGTVSRWVFLPAIHLTDATICQLKYFYSIYADQSSPYLGVYVASAPTPASAQLLRSYNTSTLGSYQLDSISLIDYVGQTVYLAFCDSSSYNYDCDNEIFLDNILVEETSECLPFSLPYSCGFEPVTDLSCWNFVDADGDGYGWTTTNIDEGVAFEGRNGGTAIGSNSYNNTSGALTPDNWLISPAITLPLGATPTLAWYDKSYSANYGDEFYAVYISTTGNNPANFTTMLYSGITTGTWARHYADLSAYAGQTVYIAFRHYNCTDQWALLLDDVTLDNNAPQYFTVTANANNSSYGSVSGGGTYLEGSSVSLYATASTDCRFAYWADGNADNPRTFSVTGNVSHTAYFEHLSGDTLRYDNGIPLSSLGTVGSSSMCWAVRFNPTVMYGYSTLQKVQFPDVASGNYTIRIYRSGSTAPGTLVTSQSVSLSGSGSMVTIDLNNPVSLNTSDPIWIVVDYSGTGYPAAYATSSGNTDGGWVYLNDTWSDISEYGYANTWMLRGIMQAAQNTYTITAVANNPSYGTVTGSGTYAQGSTVTLTATPNAGYQFTNWQDGNTNATRTITVSGNATYTAYFAAAADTCLAITSFPYTMGFESTDDLSCWNFVDADDDVYGWTTTNTDEGVAFEGRSGGVAIGSNSYSNTSGALTPDNWMITPQIQLPANAQYNLSWYDKSYSASYGDEFYAVYISTTGNNPADFTTMLYSGTSIGIWARQYVNLSSYAGQTVYIAFRHYNCTNQWALLLDDITIDNNVPQYYTVTANANNSSYGSVSGDGTYLEGSAVTLYATASADCRFAYWNDGNADNPRTFAVTGNVNHTAYFEHLSGDTLRYDNGIHLSSLGRGGSMSWAVRFNPTVMYGYSTLQKVQFPDVASGSYTIRIHRGGSTAPGTLITSQSVSLSGSGSMVTIDLNNPVSLNAIDPIWIVVDYSGTGYPAAYATSSGNTDGGWVSLDGSSWSDISEYGYPNTWILRGIMQAAQNTYTITAVANNPSYGTVTGSGTYAQGSTVTLTATPNAGYQFTNWQDGNTNATRTITVSGNATYTAYFAATADTCSAITSFPYTMGFESTDDLSCWNFVDADGDNYGWDLNTWSTAADNYAHTGTGVIGSASFINNVGVLTPDNWMITPQMQLPANAQFNLSWWVKAVDTSYYAENYTVYVSTTGNQPANFTTVLFNGTVEGASYVQKNIDLSAYAGQNIYIAFRHHNITDMYWMLIDDITITIDTNNCIPVSNVVASNVTGNSATISWTAGDPSQNNFVVAYGTGTDPSQMSSTNSSATTINLTGLAGSTTYNVFVKAQCDANNASVWNSVSFTTPRVWGDTIFYDDGIFASSIGTGSPVDIYWGIKVNAEDLIGRAELTDVMLYVESPGTYDLTVYQGGAYAPQTAMVTQSITCTTDTAQWKTIHLTNPMPINATQPLWITFHNDDVAYPAAGSIYTGDPNSSFISLDGSSWDVLSSYELSYSWMIRAITSATSTPQYDVTISCMGTGSGEVKRTDSPGSNLCGTVDRVYEGFVATYKFLPSQGSELTHLYVNNIDRINEVQTSSSASSSSYSLWSFTPSGNTTIYSVFDLRNFIVTATASNPAQGSVTGYGSYPYGSSVTLTAQPGTGHHFVCWSISTPTDTTTSFQNPYVGTITGDMSATAYFAPDSYLITITANDITRGVVTGSGEYLYSETVTATATPYSGYYFAGWSNGTSYNPYTFPATQDLVLQALFLPEDDTSTYVVSAMVNDPTMGSVTGAGTYDSGQQATITAQPFEGYHFVYWEISEGSLGDSYTSTQNPYVFTVEGFMEFRAIFAIDTFEIMVSPNDSLRGTVSGSGQYTYLETVTATATPYGGYYFAGWNNGDIQNPYVFQVTGNETLVALFLPEGDTTTYQITVSVNDSTMGEVTGGGTYRQGERVTLNATAYDGYRFDNWSDGSTENPRMVVVTEDKDYVAYFSSTTGIGDVRSVLAVLYPNPTTGKIYVDADEVERIQVYDPVGRLVGVYEHTNVVDLSGYVPGIYALRILMPQGDVIKKVVKADF